MMAGPAAAAGPVVPRVLEPALQLGKVGPTVKIPGRAEAAAVVHIPQDKMARPPLTVQLAAAPAPQALARRAVMSPLSPQLHTTTAARSMVLPITI